MQLTPAEKRRKIKTEQAKIIRRQPRIPVSGVGVPVASRTKEEFQRRPLKPSEQKLYKEISIPAYEATPAGKAKIEEPKGPPSQFRKAMGTIRDRVAAGPATTPKSLIFNKAKEGAQRQSEGPSFPDTFGSMYIKDPVTGKNVPREGYYNEAGTFIPGPRLPMHRAGTMYNYMTRGVKDPEARKVMAQGVMGEAGKLDPETGRIGSELARTGEQTLSHIRGRYLENVARIQGESRVEEAGVLSEGRDRTTTPLAQFAHRPTEEGSSIYSKFTGRDVGNETELPTNVRQRWESMKAEERKRFYMDNPQYRSALKRL